MGPPGAIEGRVRVTGLIGPGMVDAMGHGPFQWFALHGQGPRQMGNGPGDRMQAETTVGEHAVVAEGHPHATCEPV